MVKKRSETGAVANKATPEQAEQLAAEIADKPYGQKKEKLSPSAKKQSAESEKSLPIGISLPESMIEKLQDKALSNKRKKAGEKSVSGLIREALEKAGY